MLDARLVDLLRRQFDHEFRERDDALRGQIMSIANDLSKRGMIDSSIHLVLRFKHIRDEFKIRASILLARTQSTAAKLGVSVTVADAMAFLGNQLDVQRTRLYAYLVGSPRVSPGIAASFDSTGSMAEAFAHQLEWLQMQLELWEAQMSRPPSSGPGSTVVNVTGDGNIIQAGIHNSSVTLVLDTDTKEKTKAALARLREELLAGKGGGDVNAQDVTGLIDDSERELSLSQPS